MSTNLENLVVRLADEAAIRDLTARFADYAGRQDYDGFARLWAEDAEWTIGEPFEASAQGTDAIVAMLRNLWAGNDYFVQLAAPVVIEIDGDTAVGRCICHEAARGPDRYYRNNGIWSDEFRRTADGWVFTKRSYHYLWLDLSAFTGDTFPLDVWPAGRQRHV